MKQYETYIASGVEWLGMIPNHWKSSKLKWLSNIYAGGTPSTNIDQYWENGSIPWLNSGTVNQKRISVASEYITEDAVLNSSTKWVPKGSLLMALAGQGKTKGMVAILEFDATCNQSVAAIVPDANEINNEYLFYWLDSNYLRIRGLAGTELRDGLNLEIVGGIYCPTPPLKEQVHIAKYLEYQNNIVNDIIKRKESLIDLLKEKKKSIINEAVTKGFNLSVKTKNSKLEWVGEIPETWDVKNLQFVANNGHYSFTGGPFGSDLKNEEYTDKGVRIIQLQNIGISEFKDNYKIYSSEAKADQLFSCNIFPGDLIIAKMADPVARACIVPDLDRRYLMASDGIRLEVNTRLFNTKFIEYSVNATYFNYQAELNSTGSTRLRIGLNTLKKLKIISPPIGQQNDIVRQLDIKTANIEMCVSNLMSQIEKLSEYRHAIILEAVTGKVDVRNWQPNDKQVA